MSLLSRTAYGFVVAFTAITALFLIGHVAILPPAPPPVDEEVFEEVQEKSDEEEVSSGRSFGDILSKLTLFPFGKKQRSFVGVVVENHEDARPHHRGFGYASLVQEFLVEGYISRFVLLFDAKRLPPEVGPVRSLRPYFTDAVLPWVSAMYHAGGSPEALRGADALSIPFSNGLNLPEHFLRDSSAPAPHDLFIARKEMESLFPEELQKREWPPYETSRALPEGGEKAVTIRLHFFNPLHDVLYDYEPHTRRYRRTNGGTVSEAKPSNLVILESPILYVGAYGRLKIDLQRGGKGLLFRSGQVYEITWTKDASDAPYVFKDSEGGEIALSSGLTWITVLETLERVDWVE